MTNPEDETVGVKPQNVREAHTEIESIQASLTRVALHVAQHPDASVDLSEVRAAVDRLEQRTI